MKLARLQTLAAFDRPSLSRYPTLGITMGIALVACFAVRTASDPYFNHIDGRLTSSIARVG